MHKIQHPIILISFIIACFSVFIPITANAATLQSGYLTFSENEDGTLTVTGYDREKHESPYRLAIKDTYLINDKSYTVSHIEESVFRDYTFYSVYIAYNITIGEYAFANITINNYKHETTETECLWIGSSVIGKHAFENATIYSNVYAFATYFDDYCFKNAYFSDSNNFRATHIGKGAFEGSTLKGDSPVSDSATYIGERAFFNSTMSYYKIPNTIETIGAEALPNNESTDIYLDYNIKDLTIYEFDFTTLTNAMFYIYESSNLQDYLYDNYLSYSIVNTDELVMGRLKPGTIVSDNRYTYKITGDNTACLLNVKNDAYTIMLDQYSYYSYYNYQYVITSIGKNAFDNVPSLCSIDFGNCIETIEDNAFINCKKLDYVNLPTTITYIGKNAFPNIDLTMSIPASIKTFDGIHITNLTNAWFEVHVDSPLIKVLSNKKLLYTTYGKKARKRPQKGLLIYVDNSSANTKTQYKISGKSTVTFLKPLNKDITKINIPSTINFCGYTYKVTKIDKKACYKLKKLKTITIGDNVTHIGDNAFANCSKLTSITFGKNVKKLGKKVLYNDKKLRKIKFTGTKLQSIGKQTFRNVSKKANIIVPTSKVKKYSRLIKNAK